MLRTVTATRYAAPLREGGSLPGLIEADDDGLYVVKFRAAGQGLKALVAEVLVGELARAAGLPIPEIVLVSVDDQLGRTEPDPEINELVTRSAGINVGLDFLPGALDYNAALPGLIDPELAARIVWFDAFTTNVDRTPRNPNMLIWHGRPWLIDHGAAIYQQHAGGDLGARAHDPFTMIDQHVLLPVAGDIARADRELVELLTPEAIAAAVALVPDALIDGDGDATRDRYRRYLGDRLQGPRAFAQTAEAARHA